MARGAGRHDGIDGSVFFYAGEPGATVDHIGNDSGILSSRIAGGAHVLTAPKLTESHQPRENGVRSDFNAKPEQVWESAGIWTITAYCACPICCGEYASGYTASGTEATEGRTAASNILPIGTEVLIEGHTYIIEDTGWTPYGENWIDIYFNDHEAALAWGVKSEEVYIR